MHWLLVFAGLGLIAGLYYLAWGIFFRIRIKRMKRWVKNQEP